MKENNTEKTLINLSNAVWESERAYGFDFLIDFYNVERTEKIRIFLPKSMIKDSYIPTWLFRKKYQELQQIIDDRYPSYRYGGWIIWKDPFKTV